MRVRKCYCVTGLLRVVCVAVLVAVCASTAAFFEVVRHDLGKFYLINHHKTYQQILDHETLWEFGIGEPSAVKTVNSTPPYYALIEKPVPSLKFADTRNMHLPI
jgi:hypothetical protein